MGWGIVNFVSTPENWQIPSYHIIDMILPDWFWQVWLIGFGLVQIVGLRYELSWPRAVASSAITGAFSCIFGSVILAQANGATPVASGVVLYLVCIFIELCATIYQVGNIVRYKEYPKWMFKLSGWRLRA